MNTGLLIVAIVVAAAGFGCLYWRRKVMTEVAVMAAVETSRAADIARMPPGTLVEVKGITRCAAPVTAEFSQRVSVHARTLIEREEVRYNDKQQRETSYTPESDNTQTVPFEVEDDSGRARVDPRGATIEARDVYNETRSSMADNFLTVAATISGGGGNTHRFREWILPVDEPIYVLGTVQGDGSIGAAPKTASAKHFIVTYESEEERASSSQTWSHVLLAIAAALFAGAAVAFYKSLQ